VSYGCDLVMRMPFVLHCAGYRICEPHCVDRIGVLHQVVSERNVYQLYNVSVCCGCGTLDVRDLVQML